MLLNRRGLMIAATQSRGGAGATRGTNLLLSANIFKGSGVTGSDSDGSHYTGGTLTCPSGTNRLCQFQAPLTASTSYTLTYDYTLTGGTNLRAEDGATIMGTPQPFTTDGSPHSANYTFTAPSTLSDGGWLTLDADGGLIGPGTIGNMYLSSP